MPVTRAVAALNGLFTFTAARSISGLTTAIIDDSAAMARASSSVSWIWRPARSPPACRLVRPPQTIPMFFPSSRSTLSLPRRKPSPVADSTTTEIMPHRMPNMVRKLRSLLARRFWTDWMMASRIAFRSPERLALQLHVVAARRALQPHVVAPRRALQLHVVARGFQSQHAGARGFQPSARVTTAG